MSSHAATGTCSLNQHSHAPQSNEAKMPKAKKTSNCHSLRWSTLFTRGCCNTTQRRRNEWQALRDHFPWPLRTQARVGFLGKILRFMIAVQQFTHVANSFQKTERDKATLQLALACCSLISCLRRQPLARNPASILWMADGSTNRRSQQVWFIVAPDPASSGKTPRQPLSGSQVQHRCQLQQHQT